MVKYVKPGFIRKHFDISAQTIRRWVDEGKIKSLKLPESKNRLIDYEDFLEYMGANSDTNTPDPKESICYARVSSLHQKPDLERQIKYLQDEFPEYRIVKDIGSGLNWKRKGLQTLVEQVLERKIQRIVVTHSDRLSRFGFDMLQWLFKKFDCTILVLNKTTDSNPQFELSEDVLSVLNYFTAKNNGIRSAQNRKNRNAKSQENKIIPNNNSKTTT